MAGKIGLMLICWLVGIGYWGFYAHRLVNQMAVFTLPSEMAIFFKRNINFLTEASIHPDKRRFVMPEEASRHYIDIDHYGDSGLYHMPREWHKAVKEYGEDTLKAYGTLPWNIVRVFHGLKTSFMIGDPEAILRLSADMGHYVADAHVPLHTTENYNGQLTGQLGIHAFWESRLPELFGEKYSFFVGPATYITDPVQSVWQAIIQSHLALDTVFSLETILSEEFQEKKYSFETKGNQTTRVYSSEFSAAYHLKLNGMVERQLKKAIKLTGDLWYSAWVDAGQPDLETFLSFVPNEENLMMRRKVVKEHFEKNSRGH